MREHQKNGLADQVLEDAHKIVALSSMGEVPAEAAADLAARQHYNIKSNLDLLLCAGGEQTLGILSFCVYSIASIQRIARASSKRSSTLIVTGIVH